MAENFTPTQQRFVDLLSDGLPHRRDEFRPLLWDELSSDDAIRMTISRIRKVLRARGEDVICEVRNQRAICYRHVRLLRSAYEA